VSHLVRVHHPCLSPTAPSPSARYPRAANNARCAMDPHHYRYSNSEKRFRMPAALLYTKFSFPGNVSIMVSNQASLPVAILSAQHATMHHHVPCLVSSCHLTAKSCSCSCLVPCLKALDKLLISFEVRRHDAASCAIRHEYAGCRWLKTPPFDFGSS
jgi:hypothetical protein